MYDKKIKFTPDYFTYEKLKRDDKILLGKKIFTGKNGKTYVFLRGINKDIRNYLFSKYAFFTLGKEEYKELRGLYEHTEISSKNSKDSSTNGS